MSGVYFDEHKAHQIDLRKTIWSTDMLHGLYKDTIGNELSDVDWIGETESAIFLIELKNPAFTQSRDVCECCGGDCDSYKVETKTCMKCGKSVKKRAEKTYYYNDFITKACKKYYGSAFFLLSAGKNKPVKYYCVVTHELTDSAWRKKATATIKTRLPFALQETKDITAKLIDDFRVLSVAEWNELHPVFPLKKI